MTPRLSVVVPFYNVGDYIHACLDSIARQTFQDFEAILVDDGSQDESGAIAKEFCERDSRFRIVSQENQGLGPARNTGVRHAGGEFVTFVDSDDMVTRHGYEKMIQTLDETGSSFVAANARRFNNSFGVRQSWLQQVPFASNRIATHILEFPDLVLDRTVWNKVYRRKFWDGFGYEFPPIRYEDYPVTLPAHLDALTVDCLSMPVYYWRERESGDSITQQKFNYGNLLDRVNSAEIVMDVIDARAPELRSRLHAHLAQVDLLALVQAFGTVPEEQLNTLIDLGGRLVDRLDNKVLAVRPGYDQLQDYALRSRDGDLLRRLAQFRLDGGLRGGARARLVPGLLRRFEHQYPGLGESRRTGAPPRRLYRVPSDGLVLQTAVRRVGWQDDVLSIRGTAEIRHIAVDARSQLTVKLVANGSRIPLPVDRFETIDSHGEQTLAGFEVRLDRSVLARLPKSGGPAQFDVALRSGRVRRTGQLRGPVVGSPGWPPGNWIDDSWIQPGTTKDGAYALRRMTDPWRLTSVTVRDDAFHLAGRLPAGVKQPRLLLNRTMSGEDVVLDVDVRDDGDGLAFTAEIPMAPTVDDANPDDPFTQRTSRGVRLVAADSARLLSWTGNARSASHVYRGRLLVLTRSPGNFLNLHESPVRLAADEVQVEPGPDGNRLTVSGELWTTDVRAITWRQFFEDSDDHVDVTCRHSLEDGRWSASVDFADLVPEDGQRHTADPLASLADWILFTEPADDPSYAVQTDPFLTSRMPVEIDQDGRSAVLRPHAGSLHLEVR